MDVRMRFKKSVRAYNDRTCIIVIEMMNISVGLIVDSVSEVLSMPEQDIVSPPDLSKGGNKFIKGIGRTGTEVKLILDCDKLLNAEMMDNLNEIQ